MKKEANEEHLLKYRGLIFPKVNEILKIKIQDSSISITSKLQQTFQMQQHLSV